MRNGDGGGGREGEGEGQREREGARERGNTSGLDRHPAHTHVQADPTSALRNRAPNRLTFPSFSDALAFQMRTLVSSLPERMYFESALKWTENTRCIRFVKYTSRLLPDVAPKMRTVRSYDAVANSFPVLA